MPLDFGIALPPWNFPQAAGDLLDRLVGEVGLDHLTVPVVTGECTQFRLARGYGSPYFHTEGGWHYQPETARYAGCGVRPPVARWCGKRDTLTPIRRYAEKHGLALYFHIDLSDGRALLEQAPELSVQNAWGDAVASCGPCVCEPAFRELLEATLCDLRRFEPAGFELAAGALMGAPALRAEALDPWDAWLALPFGPAARQIARRAGLDVEAVRQALFDLLEAHRTARRPRVAAGPAQDADAPRVPEVVSTYASALRADLEHWLAGVAAAGPQRFLLECAGSTEAAPVAPEGWEALLAAPIDMLGAEQAEALLERWIVLPGCRALATPAEPAHAVEADQYVRAVMRVVRHGVRFIEFTEVEVATDEVVTWLRQAVRYARREVDA